MVMAKRSAGRGAGVKIAALVVLVAGGGMLFLGGACKDSKQAGKETRRTVDKGKELLKEGLDKTKDVAKEGLEKGSEAVQEGIDKTKDAAQDFKKGWEEEGKRK